MWGWIGGGCGGYFAGYSVCVVEGWESGGGGSFGGECPVIRLGIFLRLIQE